MKAVLVLTLSFLFASLTNLPLAFSKDDREPVKDTDGIPLFSGRAYLIRGKDGNGVVTVGTQNENEICPVTVFNDASGLPVKFTRSSPGIIYTGTLLDIDFIRKPNYCEKSRWSVFNDGKHKTYVGIGRSKMIGDKFRIQKYRSQSSNSYKLVFDYPYLPLPIDIGTDGIDGGRSLVLTVENEPFQVDFEHVRDPTIKSVV